jgi:uncharacterized membrane protein YqiK
MSQVPNQNLDYRTDKNKPALLNATGIFIAIPLIESVKRLSPTSMPWEINIKKALCKDIIPVNIERRAKKDPENKPAIRSQLEEQKIPAG